MNKIQLLNDSFRKHMLAGMTPVNGRVLITDGINSLGDVNLEPIVKAVVDFDKFCADNDPYHEHDFGSIDYKVKDNKNTTKVFWKIDYYDHSMEAGSPDPADNDKTTRVLTIMLASEY